MSKILKVIVLLVIVTTSARSQSKDTIFINPSKVNTSALIPGTHRYLIYFKLGKDSSRTRYQFWTRKIDFIIYQGREAISVTQEWEDNDTVFHKVYTVCERYTFSTLYQESWFRGISTRVHDFIKKEASTNGRLLSASDTAIADKRNYTGFQNALNQYFLNWHLDLEVFSTLPYKESTTYLINYYDPGFTAPEKVAYTVKGSERLKMSNGDEIDCWLLYHAQSSTSEETFWINKKTKEVMKLEQGFGGRFQGRFRYKIKLPFGV